MSKNAPLNYPPPKGKAIDYYACASSNVVKATAFENACRRFEAVMNCDTLCNLIADYRPQMLRVSKETLAICNLIYLFLLDSLPPRLVKLLSDNDLIGEELYFLLDDVRAVMKKEFLTIAQLDHFYEVMEGKLFSAAEEFLEEYTLAIGRGSNPVVDREKIHQELERLRSDEFNHNQVINAAAEIRILRKKQTTLFDEIKKSREKADLKEEKRLTELHKSLLQEISTLKRQSARMNDPLIEALPISLSLSFNHQNRVGYEEATY